MVPGQRRRRAQGRRDGRAVPVQERKKAIGPFKRSLWTLPEAAADQIAANLRAKFGLLFDELGIAGTRAEVERFVTGVAVRQPLPVALGGSGAAAATAGASVFEDDGSGE